MFNVRGVARYCFEESLMQKPGAACRSCLSFCVSRTAWCSDLASRFSIQGSFQGKIEIMSALANCPFSRKHFKGFRLQTQKGRFGRLATSLADVALQRLENVSKFGCQLSQIRLTIGWQEGELCGLVRFQSRTSLYASSPDRTSLSTKTQPSAGTVQKS